MSVEDGRPGPQGHDSAVAADSDTANLDLGPDGEAQRHLDRAYEVLEQALGPDHPGSLGLVHTTGQLRLAQGRPREAVRLFGTYLEKVAANPDTRPVEIASIEHDLVFALWDAGEHARALATASRAVSVLEEGGRFYEEEAMALRKLLDLERHE